MAVLAQVLKESVLQSALQGNLSKRSSDDTEVKETLKELQSAKTELCDSGKILKKKPTSPFFNDSEYPFEIPESWEWVQLSDVSIIQEGAGIRKHQYANSGIQLLCVTNILNGLIDLENKKIFVTKEEYEEKYKHLTPVIGDIVTACSGGSWGKVAIYNSETITMLNTSTLRMRFFKDLANNKYLYYVTQSTLFKRQLAKQLVGMQPNFGYAHYSRICFPFPPIEEQQRIVEKLEEILPQIDEYEKTEMKLEALKKEFPAEMVKSLFQAACQGKLTKQLETDSNVTSLFEELNITEYDGANPYEIPDTWKFAELEDLVSYTIKRGKSPKYVDKSKVYVFAQKCNLKYGTLSLSEAKYLDEKTLSKYNDEDYLQDKDIVINSTGGGTMGRVKMFDISIVPDGMKIVPDSHVTTVRIKEGLNKDYIYYIIKNMQPYLESKGVGSTNQKELKPDVIKGLVIPIPPIEEQQRIVEKLDNILPHCNTLI